MNPESAESAPAGIELPLCDVAIVLTKAMDQLFMDTIRPLSLEQDPETRAEFCAIAIEILEGGKRKAVHLPSQQKPACILLEGEFRVLAGMLKAMVKEESQPARSVLYELLVILMGNGWRRGEHINAVRV